ncbi:HAMP domain-containing protein [Sphingomonas sp. MMS24-JH45]
MIALAVADDRDPVGELVQAARRVEGGDLSARVTETVERNKLGVLSNAFNEMTARLNTEFRSRHR